MSTNDKPQVEYRRLGKSGLRVSVPILGAMSFGDPKWGDWPISEQDALPLLKHAWDRGVNTWDTANVYSNGESERIIGKAIKKYNIPRSKLIILTKCFGLVHDTDTGARTIFTPKLKDTRDYVNQSGLSRQAIFNAVDNSLKRLETDYIDLLQIHRFDPNTPVEETMEALHDLIKLGKVRYIGASSMWTWQFQLMNHVAEIHGWTKFISMQNQYSLLYREEEREMNAYCNYAGIGLIPWGPLCAGVLCRPAKNTEAGSTARADSSNKSIWAHNFTEPDKVIIAKVEDIAKKKGWTMTQVALAWINDKVSSPIVGFSKPSRIEEAIIPNHKLTEEEIKELEAPYVPTKIRGHS